MNSALPTDVRRVEVRCEDCARDLGPAAPTLVVAAMDDWGWELIALGERHPGAKPLPRHLRGLVTENTTIERGSRTRNQHHLRGRVVELACRKCKRSGRRRRRVLYELAEAARAAGRSDAYLSLG